MIGVKRVLPSITVIALIVGAWWAAVIVSGSVVFPTPWRVVTGTLELIRDGTLWQHIGASLFRVGTGFGLAVLVAVPMGLWMGWVKGAYITLNPLFQMLRPISPIAWIPIAILWFGVGDMSPIFLIFISSVFPMVVQTSGRAHDRETLPARGVTSRLAYIVPPGRDSCRAAQIIVGMRIGLGVRGSWWWRRK